MGLIQNMWWVGVMSAPPNNKEEETMTTYSGDDLKGDWEFKILRSQLGSFGKRERLQVILEEEALAGWKLVEKFDAQRIRLKRPSSAKARDGDLKFDPYRTLYPENPFASPAVLVAVGAAIASIGAGFAVFMINQGTWP
ncbi:MAG: hypothetical protein KDD66_15655 [Bdellovibrionales bacterium]|nr:hypothetical protein [Bdellovibrionales bacterium]